MHHQLQASENVSMNAAMPDTSMYQFGAALCLANAGRFYRFAQSIGSDSRVVVDGANVSHVDVAGVQCLLAVARQFKSMNTELIWRACSARLGASIDALGCAGELRLPPVD